MLLDHIKSRLIGTFLGDWLEGIRSQVKRAGKPHQLALVEEDWAIRRVYERVLTPTSNCIDIGCHLGSVLATMKKIANNGKHMAFEPVPYKAAWLKKKFPEVVVHEVCLSDELGEVIFFCDCKRSGYSGMRRVGGTHNKVQQITVPSMRLDDIIPEDYMVDLIKIDTEGAELYVLQGARRLLSTKRPILILECTVFGTKRFDHQPEAVYDYLHEIGYELYLPRDWMRNGEPLTRSSFSRASVFPPVARNFVASTLEHTNSVASSFSNRTSFTEVDRA